MSNTDKCLKETFDYSVEDAKFMEMAINLSVDNIDTGGGPFGAVIVRDGEVIATGANRVVPNSDPTAHAEVSAIRRATKKMGTYDLQGCEIYSSCEPCPMCLGAIYWAHIDKIYYANDRKDAARIGFDDDFIYQELELKPQYRKKPSEIFMQQEARKAFDMWMEKDDKTEY
jgi:tRNA(Arg) A34 adenosine deaminase TadA